MDKQEVTSNESPIETVAASSSKVTPPKNKAQQKLTALSIAIGFILFIGLSILLHHTTGNSSASTTDTTLSNNDASDELKENIRALKAQPSTNHEIPSATFFSGSDDRNQSTNNHAETSKTIKQLLARQNAPTNMFSAEASSSTYNNTDLSKTKNIQQATLVGASSNDQFANQNTTTAVVEATKIAHPKYTIASGELIHAVLETAINSDLPGMVRAVISQPAYAYLGEKPLIPAGSRIIGQYSSGLVMGQRRVMVIWNRVILPDGTAVQINSPEADSLGRAGQGADSVNTHFIARFGEATLLSIMGAGTSLTGVSNDDQFNSASAYRMAVSQSFQQSASQSLQGTLPMQPTLHIYQGASINVFVAHDLDFYNVFGNQNNA